MTELEIKTILILLGFKEGNTTQRKVKWRLDRVNHEFILYLPGTGTYAYTNVTMTGYKDYTEKNIQELLESL